MATRETFGLGLKLERERRQIPLEAIADSTKIRLPLLAALEAGDASHWPDGIFRRAFVRQYVVAVGLPPDPILAEFERLFAETAARLDASGEPHALAPDPDSTTPDNELRMVLVASSPAWTRRVHRGLGAFGELGAIVLCSGVLASVLDVDVWILISLVALTYYPFVSALAKSSLDSHWLPPERRQRHLRAILQRIQTAARHLLTTTIVRRSRPPAGARAVAAETSQQRPAAAS